VRCAVPPDTRCSPSACRITDGWRRLQIEDYVHRIGRTGRAGNDGAASAFITPKDARLAKDLEKILQVPASLWLAAHSARGSYACTDVGSRSGRCIALFSLRRDVVQPWPATPCVPETATLWLSLGSRMPTRRFRPG